MLWTFTLLLIQISSFFVVKIKFLKKFFVKKKILLKAFK